MTPYPARARDYMVSDMQEMAKSIGASVQPRELSGWKKFISIRQLWDEHDRFLDSDEALRFRMIFDVAGVVQVKSAEQSAQEDLSAMKAQGLRQHESSLGQDLEALRGNADCSNLVLHCGSHIFSVHKQILQVRCPKFYVWLLELAHANSKIRICKSTDPILSKVAKITDIDPETLKAFLEYIYSGSIKSLPKVFSKWQLLLLLAEQNDLKKLQELCFFHMLKMMDMETVGPLICLVHLYNPPEKIHYFIHTFCHLNYKVLMKNEAFNKLREENPSAFRFLDTLEPYIEENT